MLTTALDIDAESFDPNIPRYRHFLFVLHNTKRAKSFRRSWQNSRFEIYL